MADFRVLIVEDDPFIAMDIESAVAEQFGDEVELIVVGSVAEARRMTAKQLACALLDIDVVGGKTRQDLRRRQRPSGARHAHRLRLGRRASRGAGGPARHPLPAQALFHARGRGLRERCHRPARPQGDAGLTPRFQA